MLEKERKFGLCFGWAMVAMLGLWLLYLLMPESWLKAYNIIGAVPVLLLTAYYIYNKKLTGPIELKLLLIWGAWLVLTRVVNGDISFSRDRDFVLHNMLSCLFFAAGFWLCGKERERVVNALCLMYGGFFSLVAMLGILAALTGAYLHVSFEDIWISLRTEGSALKYVSFLNAHRLTAATRFFPAWIMMLWLFVREKGWLKRLVLGCCVLAIHMAVALCHSRTLQIVMALCYGMLAMLLVLKYLQKRTWLLRICCMALSMAAVLLIAYKSFDVSNICVEKASTLVVEQSNKFRGTEPEEESTQPEPRPLAAVTPAASPAPKQSMIDQRSLLGNVTLTGRTGIWKSGLVIVSEDARIALFGGLRSEFMVRVNDVLHNRVNPWVTEVKNHMHNVFMQVLMITGIPGLLMFLGWALLLTVKAVKIFFCDYSKAGFEIKVLTLLIAGMFIYNMAETFLIMEFDVPGFALFMLSGIFLSYYYEIFPSKK